MVGGRWGSESEGIYGDVPGVLRAALGQGQREAIPAECVRFDALDARTERLRDGLAAERAPSSVSRPASRWRTA